MIEKAFVKIISNLHFNGTTMDSRQMLSDGGEEETFLIPHNAGMGMKSKSLWKKCSKNVLISVTKGTKTQVVAGGCKT